MVCLTIFAVSCSSEDEQVTSPAYSKEQLIGTWREYKAFDDNEWVYDDIEFVEWGFSYGHAGYWNCYKIDGEKYQMEWNLNGNQLIIIERDITKIYTDTYTIEKLTDTELVVWIKVVDPEEGIWEVTRYFKRVGY